MVIGHGSLSLYDLISHNSSNSRLAYVHITLTWFDGVVDYSNTLARAYSSALIHYLVPLDLDHVDHGTTTTFVRTKVAKVDLTTDEQGIWPYQHIHQSVRLPPTC